MAAKYLRKQTWWVRFYHPLTRALVRESLGTPDEARAELLRRRVELEAELLDPRFQAAAVPENVRCALGIAAGVPGEQDAPPDEPLPAAPPPPAPISPTPRVAVDEALRGYFDFIRTDNAARHVENKISMLRRFLGGQRAEQFVTSDDPVTRARRLKKAPEPFFTGTCLDEMTPSLLREFFTHLDLSTKTKRHYGSSFTTSSNTA